MKPYLSVLTLGVDDLQRAFAFYRDGLGLASDGIVGEEFENGAVAFFELNPGLKLALWPRSSMAADTGLPLQNAALNAITLGHNLNSPEEVDELMAQARKAGALIVKDAQETFWGGYAGYFQDPDAYLWEIVWNPQLQVS